MEWVWIVIVVAAVGALLAVRWWRARRAIGQARAEELEGVRQLIDEDVAEMGEQVHRLGREVEGRTLDEETRDSYRAAVDSHDSARGAASRIGDAAGISAITASISTGRNALACVQARLVGEPVPGPRVMCFFDPRHGRSVADVLWTRPGHGPRRVPVCSQDAERVAGTLAPEIRTVRIGARATPYWAAGGVFQAYTEGYFASSVALSWAFHPAVSDAAAGSGPPGYLGTGVTGSSGRFDGGGFDGSGGGA